MPVNRPWCRRRLWIALPRAAGQRGVKVEVVVGGVHGRAARAHGAAVAAVARGPGSGTAGDSGVFIPESLLCSGLAATASTAHA